MLKNPFNVIFFCKNVFSRFFRVRALYLRFPKEFQRAKTSFEICRPNGVLLLNDIAYLHLKQGNIWIYTGGYYTARLSRMG